MPVGLCLKLLGLSVLLEYTKGETEAKWSWLGQLIKVQHFCGAAANFYLRREELH